MAKIENKDLIADDLFLPAKKNASELTLEIEKLTTTINALKEVAKSVNKELNGIKIKNVDDIKKVNEAVKTSKTTIEGLTKIEKDRIKLLAKLKEANSDKIQQNVQLELQLKEQRKTNKEIERQKLVELGVLKDTKKAVDKTTVAYQKELIERAKIIKESKDEATFQSKLISLYDKKQKGLSILIKRQQDLSLKQKLGTKLTKEEEKELSKLNRRIVKLGTALKQVDAENLKFNRNVGNYPNNFQKATKSSIEFGKSLIGAFGIIGGVQLFASAIRNTIKRVVDFDKEIVGLSAILGENRKDLSSLEKQIIKVAGSSINTSNEVAKLATALVTLGKSKNEVILLLEPVNNLAIGLQTTSAEAGELLVQTLNAFGESSSEASRFADIIAKMRTSTALDFTRIKDSLGFLAPVAKAAGISFEETASILGVLVDNGIKASRAGRLMSTSFLRLAKNGISLEQALSEINTAQKANVSSQELLNISTRLFGTESSALGLILANNIEKTADLTKEFKNAQGTLDDLTETQLQSLSAKLKLLDSAWESFILSLEKGDSAMAKFVSGSIQFLINALQQLTVVGSLVSVMFKGIQGASLNAVKDVIKLNSATLESGMLFSEFVKKFDKLDFQRLVHSKDTFLKLAKAQGENTKDAERLFEAYVSLRKESFELEQQSKKQVEQQKKSKEETKKETESVKNKVEKITDLIKIQEELLKQANLLSGNTEKEIAERNTKIEGINKEISRLKALREIQLDELKTIDTKSQKQIKHNKDLLDNQAELDKSLEDFNNREALRQAIEENRLARIEREKLERRQKAKDFERKLADETIKQIEREANARQEALSNEVSSRKENITNLQKLAEEGNISAAKQLQFEQEQLVKAELRKKQIAQREASLKQSIQLVDAYFTAYNRFLEDKEIKPSQASAKALAEVGKGYATSEVVKALVTATFIDGTENVGESMGKSKFFNDGIDDYLGYNNGKLLRFDGDERILNPEQNKKLKGIDNELLANVGNDFINGKLQYLTPNIQETQQDNGYIYFANSIKKLNSKIEENGKRIENAINNKPVQHVDLDNLGNIINSNIANGVKEQIKILVKRGKIGK